MRIEKEKLKNFSCDFHRNGVSGAGFYLFTFDYEEEGVTRKFIGVTFRSYESGWEKEHLGCTTILSLSDLSKLWEYTGEIRDKVRAWRGDNFEDAVVKNLEEFYKKKYPDITNN